MKKYLKDIFIHLDGVAMAPIYEILSSNNGTKSILDISDGVLYTRYDSKENRSKLNESYCSILCKIFIYGNCRVIRTYLHE